MLHELLNQSGNNLTMNHNSYVMTETSGDERQDNNLFWIETGKCSFLFVEGI